MRNGERGIRTPGEVTPTQHFQCCTFGRSVTSPDTKFHITSYSTISLYEAEAERAVFAARSLMIINTIVFDQPLIGVSVATTERSEAIPVPLPSPKIKSNGLAM